MKMLHMSSSPHVHNGDNTRNIMLDVLIALTPALIWGIYIFGPRALSITVLSVGSAVLFEFLFQRLMKRPVAVSDFSAAVTGLLFAFSMPVSSPLWTIVIGTFFAIVVVKQLFGGIGKNIVNPVLAAKVFLFTAWPTETSTFTVPKAQLDPFALSIPTEKLDAVTTATPLVSLKNGELPETSLLDLFFGNNAGCIGEVSALLLIVGGIYLLSRKVISYHIPLCFISTVAVVAYLFPLTSSSIQFMGYEVLSGVVLLGAIFMATDYVTSPATKKGKIIFGIGCGLITVFIRYFGAYAEGVSFAILIMNVLVWYIDRYTKPVPFGGKKK